MPDLQDQGLSRRKFLKGTAAGLTGLGVLAVAPGLVSRGSSPDAPAASNEFGSRPSSPDAPAASKELGSRPSDPLVAYVRDARKGEVVLMIGTKEVVRKDPALVAHLVDCCQV